MPGVTPNTIELRTVKHLAGLAKHYLENPGPTGGPPLSFLIGAGFSVSAGVPTATEIIEKHLKPHDLLQDVPPKPADKSEYNHLMSELTPQARIQLIRGLIGQAQHGPTGRSRINWAHLLLAYLVEAGYVRYVLTTNFDPVMVDALSLLGQPIRTFDVTAAGTYEQGGLENGSVIYLHGQAHSLWLANSDEELDNARQHIRGVFNDVLAETTMVIVGYSGDCDPVAEELSACRRQFARSLYWVPYESKDRLGSIAREMVCDRSRDAFAIDGHDADSFMRSLVLDELNLALPKLLQKPRELMLDHLQRIEKFPDRRDGGPEIPDPLETAKADLTRRLSPAQHAKSDLKARIRLLGIRGGAKEFESLLAEVKEKGDVKLNRLLGDAGENAAERLIDEGAYEQGIGLLEVIVGLEGHRAHWAWMIWGNGLLDQARAEKGRAADALFEASFEKYTRAVEIEADIHQAYSNWGNALSDQARTKRGGEADALFEASFEKYARAVELRADYHEAFYNWGNALMGQAFTKRGEEADALFEASYEKYARAAELKADDQEVFYNWGVALVGQARTKRGGEADALFEASYEKYARAVELKADDHEAYSSWGNALSDQACTKYGEVADALFEASFEKFEHAAKLKPDDQLIFDNWGYALFDLARTKPSGAAAPLIEQAEEKIRHAIGLDPGDENPHLNLACLSAWREDAEQAVAHLEAWRERAPDARRGKLDDDKDFDPIRASPAFQAFRASLPG